MPYILIIRERRDSWAGRGPIAVVHSSEEAAQAVLLDYVRENWGTKMGEHSRADFLPLGVAARGSFKFVQ